jgi:hypothetical protein
MSVRKLKDVISDITRSKNELANNLLIGIRLVGNNELLRKKSAYGVNELYVEYSKYEKIGPEIDQVMKAYLSLLYKEGEDSRDYDNTLDYDKKFEYLYQYLKKINNEFRINIIQKFHDIKCRSQLSLNPIPINENLNRIKELKGKYWDILFDLENYIDENNEKLESFKFGVIEGQTSDLALSARAVSLCESDRRLSQEFDYFDKYYDRVFTVNTDNDFLSIDFEDAKKNYEKLQKLYKDIINIIHKLESEAKEQKFMEEENDGRFSNEEDSNMIVI